QLPPPAQPRAGPDRRDLHADGVPGGRRTRDRGRVAQLRGAQHPPRPPREDDEGLPARRRGADPAPPPPPPEPGPVHARTRESQEPPISVVVPGRTYRRGAVDATHLSVFHQVEGLAVDEGISFADLRGTLEAFAREMFGEDVRVRLTPDYFPFVEPGCQAAVSCFVCGGVGCRVCGNGWLELLGAGMVHPKVLENCGIDSERYTGFAFGMGIERGAMVRYGVNDMRLFVEGDVRFLERFEGAA